MHKSHCQAVCLAGGHLFSVVHRGMKWSESGPRGELVRSVGMMEVGVMALPLLDVGPWTGHFTPPDLSFLICNLELPPTEVALRSRWDNKTGQSQ